MRGNNSLTTVFAVAVAVAAVGCTRTTVGTPVAAAGPPTVMSPPPATVMSPPTEDIDTTVRRIGEDVTLWWSRNGVDIGPIEYRFTTSALECAGATDEDGEALFCHHRSGGGDAKFRTQALTQLHRETGDVGVEIVVAHELGHGVQYATGYHGESTAWELSADCFAGAYLAESGAEFHDVMDALPHTQLTTIPGAGTAIGYGGGEISSGIVGKSLIDHCLNYRP